MNLVKFCPACAAELAPIVRADDAEQYAYQVKCPACGVLAGLDRHQQYSRDPKTGQIIESALVWRFRLTQVKGAA